MKHLTIFENFGNYYQDMTPESAIEKAKLDFRLANKKGNVGQVDKILGNLKTHLDDIGYNWRQDPQALELLGDYLD